jgi:hypothetical protein
VRAEGLEPELDVRRVRAGGARHSECELPGWGGNSELDVRRVRAGGLEPEIDVRRVRAGGSTTFGVRASRVGWNSELDVRRLRAGRVWNPNSTFGE